MAKKIISSLRGGTATAGGSCEANRSSFMFRLLRFACNDAFFHLLQNFVLYYKKVISIFLKCDVKAYLYIAGMLLLFSACVRNSEMQTEGADFLQGVWVQDSIPGQEDMLNYTLHEIKFICDSMYTTLRVHSKVKNIPDSCYKDGNWKEYAKGVYVVRADSIMVSGIYTRENGRQKVSGCYRQGQYLPRFKIVHQSADSIVLESRYDQRLITLRKTEEVECIPKKRWEY